MSKYIITHDPGPGRFNIYKTRFWFGREFVCSVFYPRSPTAGDLTDALAQAKTLVARFKDIDDSISRC